jgi:DNA-binding SARP family transcriptional activator
LLAYLALSCGVRVRREVLMAEFWPDAEPRNARNNLKTALSSIRRLFRDNGEDPDDVVVADRDYVRWLCPVSVDVRAIERCALDIAEERSRAIAAYAGDLLPGDYHAWAIELRTRLMARYEDVVRAELLARPSAALAEQLLALDPYSSDAFTALIDDALAAGKRREARAHFDRYASVLEEIGAVPSAALEARVAADTPAAQPYGERLAAAGDDACDVAELLALEAELDDDDLVVLLDWSLERVVEATKRLLTLGIVAARRPARFTSSAFAEIAARRSTSGHRRATIARIAERLALHEKPQSKLRLAGHYVTLGRTREAASASLEAGNAFMAFAAWTNALTAFDAALERLDSFATSHGAKRLLCDAHFGRADALVQLGQFLPAIRSLGSALDLTDPIDDAAVRARGYVKTGHAFARLNNIDAAWMAVRQAELATPTAGVLAKLDLIELASRLLCIEQRFDVAAERAIAGYNLAIAAGAHRQASTLAQRVAEPLRRMLQFDECARWTELQLGSAIVAGPEIEAQALYAVGAVAYSRNQLGRSESSCREALRILEGIRRRAGNVAVPLGLLEWQCHQALAHITLLRGQVADAVKESAWLVRSPWMLNTTSCSAITFATAVDVWLASGTRDHRRAAFALEERIPPLRQSDPSYFLDVLTRARLAAISGPPSRALEALHAAHAATVAAESHMPDQIHISYEKLAVAARGIDDVLAARSSEAARRHHAAVMSAAGGAWSRANA